MSISKQTTIIIVTIRGKISINSLKSLYKKYRIIIIENTNNKAFKKKIKNKFNNIEVYLSKKNLGFGKANNLGIKKVKTPHTLMINPDVEIRYKDVSKLEIYAKKINDFSILTVYSNGIEQIMNANLDKVDNSFHLRLNNRKKKQKIPWVPGWCMYCKTDDLNKIKGFDENYYLYFEELDLCKRLKKMNKSFYLINDIKIFHKYHGTEDGLSDKMKKKYWYFRMWHYYWSSFYYHRKHYGYFKALKFHLSKLARFCIIKNYYLLNNKDNTPIEEAKFKGLLNSILSKKSHLRLKL
ncbi:glycosyltransferase [Candidatus Pelagibacter sp.]|jgi:N-acetylglucosaminyl-diphospho-decaprenol L-rhamnosyltransferase|nr:glycosyltransferase [Candidatus Pelagibacter sp.]MDC1139960.1 glycosyltransferase [Candidatus Pelagibacter sp.]